MKRKIFLINSNSKITRSNDLVVFIINDNDNDNDKNIIN